jgi:SAM-dependent methyltransferase
VSERILNEHRIVWQDKPVLRAIYADFYRRIIAVCRPGPSLEIGGGSGNLKDFARQVVSTDVVPTPWLDAAADAQALPFAGESFANIVMVDVLHHIERPRRFFAEAERVLQPGGRIIFIEPDISPVSWFFYRYFHPEPVVITDDPLGDGALDPTRKPFDANQAVPTLLLGRHRQRLKQAFPRLDLIEVNRFGFFAYPLSGGFRPWCLIPSGIVEPLLRVEAALSPVLGHLMAFRLFAVFEKAPA